jgi:hypothetical protein
MLSTLGKERIFVVKAGNVKSKQFPRGVLALMQNEGSFLRHNHFYNFKESTFPESKNAA